MSRSGQISQIAQWLQRVGGPALPGIALASLVANIGIVVTGGAVRLTKSGLGCPTWPRCVEGSYTPTPEMGVHGVIEFTNRLLFFVVGVLAFAALVVVIAQRPRRRSLVWLAAVTLAGIPMQGVIGGITVLTRLNPWVVGLHFLASMVVIVTAYLLWVRSRESDAPALLTVPAPVRSLAAVLTAVCAVVLVLGVVVTGSGPHAGDRNARRTGLDPQAVAQAHADVVMLLIGLSVALWFTLRAVRAPGGAVRAAAWLVGVELGQGLIGFAQYFTHLPIVLVGLHMLGSCLVWVATLAVLTSIRVRQVPEPGSAPAAPRPELVGATR